MAIYETELEDMIDSSSLEKVLENLESICYYKAEHLRSIWQDMTAAKIWERAGKVVGRAVTSLPIYPGIK